MRGIGEGQAQARRQIGAAKAGAQNPDRDIGALARNGAHFLARRGRLEKVQQLFHVTGKFRHVVRLAPQRLQGLRIAGDAAAQPQIDAARIQRRQGAELLGHHQRRMIGQHDAAGADADGAGMGGDMGHQHRGGGAGHRWRVVMLHQPVAVKAQPLGGARQCHRLAEGVGDMPPWRMGVRSRIESGIMPCQPFHNAWRRARRRRSRPRQAVPIPAPRCQAKNCRWRP